jgi:hypothetical protein
MHRTKAKILSTFVLVSSNVSFVPHNSGVSDIYCRSLIIVPLCGWLHILPSSYHWLSRSTFFIAFDHVCLMVPRAVMTCGYFRPVDRHVQGARRNRASKFQRPPNFYCPVRIFRTFNIPKNLLSVLVPAGRPTPLLMRLRPIGSAQANSSSPRYGSSSLTHACYLSFISLKEFLMGFFSPTHSFCSVVPHICSRVHDFVPLLIWARTQVRRPFSDLVGLFNSWYNVSDGMGL